MTSIPKGMMLLNEEACAYYVLPQEMLDPGNVRAEQIAEAEQLVATSETDDVEGYLNFAKITYNYGFGGGLMDERTAIESTLRIPAANAGNSGINPGAGARVGGRLK